MRKSITSSAEALNQYIASLRARFLKLNGGKPLTAGQLTELQLLEYEVSNPPRPPFGVDMSALRRKR